MKKNIIVSFALIVCGVFHTAIAQQDALFTQYIDAQLYANPAEAGCNDHVTIAGIHRQQWAGFQGAPMTSGIMVHSPLHYESVAIGLDLWNDRLGTLNRTTAAANFAYRFKFKNGGKFSVGIKALADFNFADISTLSNADNDPRAQSLANSITPNAGVGVMYRSPKWFMGVGVPRLLKNQDSLMNGGYSNQMQAYILAGVLINMSDKWVFRPTTQVRGSLVSPLSIDLTATFIGSEKLYFGLNYRFGASVGFIAQYQLNQQIKLGYSFDLGTTAVLRTAHFGSHEVVMTYDMNYSKSSIASPRFF
ncbi:MAG: PorP/SprF family type IX secretion system membrane protein [Crocinitomicaceae bacterium]|nr:PorP/SprF family type IX secretion system membrane protein [Crocinitomicaceae bacterium]